MASDERIAGRIERILIARKKCAMRLDAHPGNSHAGNWQRKIAEYDESLANFQKYAQESAPTGNRASVSIDVPKGTFSVKAFPPEG